MLRSLRIRLVIVLALTAVGCSQADRLVNRPDARITLDSLEVKLAVLQQQTALQAWQLASTGKADSLDFFHALFDQVAGDAEVFSILRTGRATLTDAKDLRRHEVLYPIVLTRAVDHSPAVRDLHDSLAEFYDSAWCRIGDTPLAPRDAWQTMFAGASDSIRQAAFRAVAGPGRAAAGRLARLLRMRNQIAKQFGYNDYLGLVSGTTSLDRGRYAAFIERVDDETRNAFEAFQQSHNIQRIWNWTASVQSVLQGLDAHLPADSQFVFVSRTLKGWGFDLTKYPIYFHLTNLPDSPADVQVLIVDAPEDIRVVGNLRSGWTGFLDLFEAVGLAIAAAETRGELPAFRRFDDPAWRYGLASLFRQIPTTPAWLTGVLGLSIDQAAKTADALRAVQLLEVRWLLVNAVFEYQLYTAGNRDPNEQYWQLFERYFRLSSHPELQPWAGQERLLTEPLSSLAELQGRTIAAQTIAHIQQRYGELVNNTNVRSFLVENYFRFGSRYLWRELVERGTGEKLNPAYLVR
jgi:hypothetical protein